MMEGQKFHTVQRDQVPKKRIQNAATCMGRGILMVSQPNLIQINTSVDAIAAAIQACCPNRLQVLIIKCNRFNNNIYIFKPGFHYDKTISIKVVRLGPPQHKRKHVRTRSTDNCRAFSVPYFLDSIKQDGRRYLSPSPYSSEFSLDINTGTRKTKKDYELVW